MASQLLRKDGRDCALWLVNYLEREVEIVLYG